ncbi:MAG: biotin--[acetyl-CoA-carboxylase] ligase [Actinobacteria bacterium]|nr:biotin--[acetyl-CoA-carboxylase] ligase [Actinomycetota bacterium]
MFTGMPGSAARTALAGTRFADVRWVAETGSTNADVIDLARQGAGEGVVVVADHQTAGRGRRGRSWAAPPGASLLVSVLLRPPARVAGMVTMAAAAAAAEAVAVVAGVEARLKWPNDLVWPGDGSAPDRKLAGLLAEADWPPGSDVAAGWRAPAAGERAVVVVGMGLNVDWPEPLPDDLAGIAVALNQICGRRVDREALLVEWLRRLDTHYGALVASGDPAPLLADWRQRSATLGRPVRVDVGNEDVSGTAVDVTADGRLVVETPDGARRTLAVGDVVHLRPA